MLIFQSAWLFSIKNNTTIISVLDHIDLTSLQPIDQV